MDKRIRELQRRYRAGDTAVAGQLIRLMVASNQIRDPEVDLLAMLGFYPAIESRRARLGLEGAWELEVPLRGSNFLWHKLGKYISLQLVIDAHIYPFERIFNHHQDWCQIIQQHNPAWNASTCDLFKDLIEQQLLGLQNWKMGSLSSIKPFNEFDSLFIKRRGDFHVPLHALGRTPPWRGWSIAEQQTEARIGHARVYRLVWHLMASAEQLMKIREITKRNRKYADTIGNWLNSVETYWGEEAANFELYLTPVKERLPTDQAREELYNYLLPKAIELILL